MMNLPKNTRAKMTTTMAPTRAALLLLLALATPAAIAPTTADPIATGPFSPEALAYADAVALSSHSPTQQVAELERLGAMSMFVTNPGPANSNKKTQLPKGPCSPGAVPVIAIPAECADLCAGLTFPTPGILDPPCVECLVLYPALPAWPHNTNFDTLDPDNTPRSTLVMDFYADPTFVSEFHSLLFATGHSNGPSTAISLPDLPKLWAIFVEKTGATWYMNTMRAQLAASGLSEARFRANGNRYSWAGLPGAAFQLQLREVAGRYATAVINAAYEDDAAVLNDAAIQQMASTLCNPEGSNVVQLHADGCALDTRARLAGFMADWVAIVVSHSSAHLQDYVIRLMCMSLSPPGLGKQTAPDPTAEYDEQAMLEWVPTTASASNQVNFIASFIATSFTFPITNLVPSQQWQKGDVPVWQDDLPIFTGNDPAEANAAHVKFIREATDLLVVAQASPGFREVVTNYQQPTRMPRVINI